MTTVNVKLANEFEEALMEAMQPLLDIAEGKIDINEWNGYADGLIVRANMALSVEKHKEASRVRKEIIKELINKKEDIDQAWTRYGGGRTYGEFVRDYLEQAI
jgi:hypothetical protein